MSESIEDKVNKEISHLHNIIYVCKDSMRDLTQKKWEWELLPNGEEFTEEDRKKLRELTQFYTILEDFLLRLHEFISKKTPQVTMTLKDNSQRSLQL
jgi:hypothetical protein